MGIFSSSLPTMRLVWWMASSSAPMGVPCEGLGRVGAASLIAASASSASPPCLGLWLHSFLVRGGPGRRRRRPLRGGRRRLQSRLLPLGRLRVLGRLVPLGFLGRRRRKGLPLPFPWWLPGGRFLRLLPGWSFRGIRRPRVLTMLGRALRGGRRRDRLRRRLGRRLGPLRRRSGMPAMSRRGPRSGPSGRNRRWPGRGHWFRWRWRLFAAAGGSWRRYGLFAAAGR